MKIEKKMTAMIGSACMIFLAAQMFFSILPSTAIAAGGKPIVLKYATALPQGHAHSVADVNWMNKVEEETQGGVKFERYFGGTLLTPNEGYAELASGIADVAWFSRIAKPAGYDLGLFLETAFMQVPSEYSLRIMDDICQKFPQIMKEYADVKTLCNPTILGEYQFLVKKPIRKLADIKGLSINCPGEVYVRLVTDEGGSAVSMGPPDWYMALQKSVIDGILLFPESIDSMKFSEVIKYVTLVNLGDGPEINRGMNWDTWNKLPGDIQAVFDRNKGFLTDQVVINFQQDNKKGLESAKSAGIELIQLPDGEMAKLNQLIVQVQDEKAAELDSKGLPATGIMKEIRHLSDQYAGK